MKRRRQRITIFFTNSETKLSRSIRLVTRCRYSHVVVADDNAVMDMTVTNGTHYIPLIPYRHLARAKQWKAVKCNYGRTDLGRFEGQGPPSLWKIGLKFFSLGLYRYQDDCIGTTIQVLEHAGLAPFSRTITSPRKLIKELERRGYK